MKAVRLSVFRMISCMRRDRMLFAACCAPILAGIFFKFIIPILEVALTNIFHTSAILSRYYKLIDVFYAMLSPIMFCFVSAMVVLEEKDEKKAVYLFVTPLGKLGYLIARFGFSSVAALLVTTVFLPFFKLTELSFISIVFLAVGATLQGIIIALLIVTLSTNKLEGMAVTKLSTLITLGAVIPFFVETNMQYVLAVLPSFWLGKAIIENKVFYMLPAFLLSFICIGFLMKKYLKSY